MRNTLLIRWRLKPVPGKAGGAFTNVPPKPIREALVALERLLLAASENDQSLEVKLSNH